jgi:hypothetical protein
MTTEWSAAPTLLEIRQIQRPIDQRGDALPIEIAKNVLLHQERGAAVEFFVLGVAAAELGAERIPNEPQALAALNLSSK